ncbi:helix-turn-helix domain-containing protein [Rhizobium vallis]|uniref:helix-turn-helix domain-containing protein n=1 Tax=Rhizobium vallis TaxID=634290 RepID=UPI003CCACC28
MSADNEVEQTIDSEADKWKLFRALCETKPLLGITDRARAVLNALLSFYLKNELAQENGSIVFPSNVLLSLRTHAIAEQTVRRHLAALVEAGLLQRKDRPNGKRCPQGQGGEVDESFSFSLPPRHCKADRSARRRRRQRGLAGTLPGVPGSD